MKWDGQDLLSLFVFSFSYFLRQKNNSLGEEMIQGVSWKLGKFYYSSSTKAWRIFLDCNAIFLETHHTAYGNVCLCSILKGELIFSLHSLVSDESIMIPVSEVRLLYLQLPEDLCERARLMDWRLFWKMLNIWLVLFATTLLLKYMLSLNVKNKTVFIWYNTLCVIPSMLVTIQKLGER